MVPFAETGMLDELLAAGQIPAKSLDEMNLLHMASSGASLQRTPGVTTTILGSFNNDMQAVVQEMGNIKSLDFGAKIGGYNVLNAPDELWKSLGPQRFFNEVNMPFLEAAVTRGDRIVLATPPEFAVQDIVKGHSVLVRPNGMNMELTGFGREYLRLRRLGYRYVNGEMIR
ncbi:MAG TPA: hypothetical protein VFS47_03630 [Steroidobacteraceae bacterium]|nr:hypothetical protein [Steroidobacteraceae bacterium]